MKDTDMTKLNELWEAFKAAKKPFYEERDRVVNAILEETKEEATKTIQLDETEEYFGYRVDSGTDSVKPVGSYSQKEACINFCVWFPTKEAAERELQRRKILQDIYKK